MLVWNFNFRISCNWCFLVQFRFDFCKKIRGFVLNWRFPCFWIGVVLLGSDGCSSGLAGCVWGSQFVSFILPCFDFFPFPCCFLFCWISFLFQSYCFNAAFYPSPVSLLCSVHVLLWCWFSLPLLPGSCSVGPVNFLLEANRKCWINFCSQFASLVLEYGLVMIKSCLIH